MGGRRERGYIRWIAVSVLEADTHTDTHTRTHTNTYILRLVDSFLTGAREKRD